ncbi:MAG: hypothetical protein WCF54_15775 [Terracidiphilus sp.]
MRRLAIKKTSIAVLLLIFLSANVRSLEPAPQLLTQAIHCLAVKSFLPSSGTNKLLFGYYFDEKSYPGEKVLYVVNFASPTRSNGLVFALFLSQDNNHQVFNIQNNASFVLSKDDVYGVSFVNPPLGGGWTQERLANAIDQIEKQPRFNVSVRDFLAADTSTSCESYTNPQPKEGDK